MESVFGALALMGTFAFFDRFCGGGLGWSSNFRGRPIYYVFGGVLFVEIVCRIFSIDGLLPYCAATIMWCAWRWPGWKLFGGSLAPKTRREIAGTFLRHSLLFGTVLVTPFDRIAVAWPLLLALVATYTYGHWMIGQSAEFGADIIPEVELGRGALFGVVLYGIFGGGQP
jgi:hypothetical protein